MRVLVAVVDAEVVVAQSGVGQQVPDDHQDGPGDCDEGLEFASALDEASVAVTQEGLGLGGAGGGLTQARPPVSVALAAPRRSPLLGHDPARRVRRPGPRRPAGPAWRRGSLGPAPGFSRCRELPADPDGWVRHVDDHVPRGVQCRGSGADRDGVTGADLSGDHTEGVLVRARRISYGG
jgi:hypothetical protein